MGLFDKLKNIFFEEEYIEVEEPVKKEKAVTVAKKIETPEAKKAKEEAISREVESMKIDEIDDEPVEEVSREVVKEIDKEVDKEKDYRFPMDFDERDFQVDDRVTNDSNLNVNEEIATAPSIPEEGPVYQEKTVYKEKTIYKERIPYSEESVSEYHGLGSGLYEGAEKKEKKLGFTPSPIISPIYGILDKNYKKEEIVTKKEVRLSVTTSRKVDLDSVREKAYGDLANDITESIHEEVVEEEEKTPVFEDNLLYDLNEDDSPAVKTVTVGDAEEYFNDLGLEYNVDYKVEKEKKEEEIPVVTRRADRTKEIDLEDDSNLNDYDSNDSDDSNLFDLIDSMYEDKE